MKRIEDAWPASTGFVVSLAGRPDRRQMDYMDDGMVTFSFAKQHSTTFASIKHHCGGFGSYDLCGSYIYSSPMLVVDTGEDGETLLGSRTDATLEQSPDLIWSVSCELQLVQMAYSRMRPATLETLH